MKTFKYKPNGWLCLLKSWPSWYLVIFESNTPREHEPATKCRRHRRRRRPTGHNWRSPRQKTRRWGSIEGWWLWHVLIVDPVRTKTILPRVKGGYWVSREVAAFHLCGWSGSDNCGCTAMWVDHGSPVMSILRDLIRNLSLCKVNHVPRLLSNLRGNCWWSPAK